MACSSIVVGGSKPVAATDTASVPTPVVVSSSLERKGLSRFYKSKSQSFVCLSESLNTEFGDSARGLAKRVKIWHQGDSDCVTSSCVSVEANAATRSRQVEWIERCAAHACVELMDLRVTDKKRWTLPIQDESPGFLIGFNPATRRPHALRVRRRNTTTETAEAESVKVTGT